MALTKEAILAANDCETHEFEVTEWGGSVFIRKMSGTARDAFERKVSASEGTIENLRAEFLALCICDDAGALLFTSEEDVKELGRKDGDVLDRLFTYAMGVNRMNDGAVDDEEKN